MDVRSGVPAVWLVHVLTASGAALALLALLASAQQAWTLVFLLLGIALIVDGIDGPIARRLGASSRIPWFDGALLDHVVDYTTYTLVPAIVVAQSDLIAPEFRIAAAVLIAVVGALYFGDTRMKTRESAFRGFPAVWNAVVFQLMVYDLAQPVNLAIIVAAAILTFVPMEFIHPFRVRRFRPVTIAMAVAWGLLAVASVVYDLDPPDAVAWALALVSLYFAAIGFVLQVLRKRDPDKSSDATPETKSGIG